MSYKTGDIISALEQSHGMIFIAAKTLGCAPVTIYRRAKTNPKVQETIDSYRGQLLDKAELKLEQAVMDGQSWAITLALKTIGKQRGYIERMETDIEHSGEIATRVLIEYSEDKNPTPPSGTDTSQE